jgi:hypothetical protein
MKLDRQKKQALDTGSPAAKQAPCSELSSSIDTYRFAMPQSGLLCAISAGKAA